MNVTIIAFIIFGLAIAIVLLASYLGSVKEKNLKSALKTEIDKLKQLKYDQLSELCDREPTTNIQYQGKTYIRILKSKFSEEPDGKRPNNTYLIMVVGIRMNTADNRLSEADNVIKRKSTFYDESD